MSLLDRLERIFGRFAIPNLSLYVVIGQVFVLLAGMLGLVSLEKVLLVPAFVLDGQWWRVITFVWFVLPPSGLFGYVFLAFRWYLFYLMGNALEQHWGTFRFNVFLLLNIVLTVAVAFLTPAARVDNDYILYSVFLAFAFLNPDFELLIIVFPVKIKWLALVTWALWTVNFIVGSWPTRLQIAASVVTFALFFGAAIVRGLKQGRRAAAHRVTRDDDKVQPRHVCHVCGKTDISHPNLDFRYCSKCAGDQCYCPEHIQNHAHVVAPENEAGR